MFVMLQFGDFLLEFSISADQRFLIESNGSEAMQNKKKIETKRKFIKLSGIDSISRVYFCGSFVFGNKLKLMRQIITKHTYVLLGKRRQFIGLICFACQTHIVILYAQLRLIFATNSIELIIIAHQCLRPFTIKCAIVQLNPKKKKRFSIERNE